MGKTSYTLQSIMESPGIQIAFWNGQIQWKVEETIVKVYEASA